MSDDPSFIQQTSTCYPPTGLTSPWYPRPKNGKPKSTLPAVLGQIITSMNSVVNPPLPPIRIQPSYITDHTRPPVSVSATLYINPNAPSPMNQCAATPISPNDRAAMETEDSNDANTNSNEDMDPEGWKALKWG